ncbi:signal peptidase I [Rhodococcus sp. (in: high G+C Gram-positive bacteria)]|uniref:signal peptidase I n=1 Tax=Rhodococcus sp. TaxID=1831 RepID=UPI003B8A6FC6
MSTPGSADNDGRTWWLRTVLGWTVLLAMFALLTATVLVPAVAGAERFTVLTGSMRPTYPPGTLVVVRPTEVDGLAIGTPITYQLESGRPDVVTHRIISVRHNAKGDISFLTQGDANDKPDPKPVRTEQIRGQVWYSIPYLGYVNNWLSGQKRAVTVAAVIVVLIGYALFNLVRDIQVRRKG